MGSEVKGSEVQGSKVQGKSLRLEERFALGLRQSRTRTILASNLEPLSSNNPEP